MEESTGVLGAAKDHTEHVPLWVRGVENAGALHFSMNESGNALYKSSGGPLAKVTNAPECAINLASYLGRTAPVHPLQHDPQVTIKDMAGAQDLFQSETYPLLVRHHDAFPKRTRATNSRKKNSTMGTIKCELHPADKVWEALKDIEDAAPDIETGRADAVAEFHMITDRYEVLNEAMNKPTRELAEAALNDLSGGDTSTAAERLNSLLSIYHSVEVLTPLKEEYWRCEGVRYEGTCAKCWSFCCCCVTYYCTVRDQRAEGIDVKLPLETEVHVPLSTTDARQLNCGRPTALTGKSHALIKPPTQNTSSPRTKGLTNRSNLTELRNSRARKTTPEQRDAMLQSPRTTGISYRTKTGLATPAIGACTHCTYDNKQASTACEVCENVRSPTKRAIGNAVLGHSTGSSEGSSSSNSEHETQLVVVQLPNEGGYVVTYPTNLGSVRQVMGQLQTQDEALSEEEYTFRREARRSSIHIHGFDVYEDYDDALATQESETIPCVDEYGTRLTVRCGQCSSWLAMDMRVFRTPPCRICSIQRALLPDSNEDRTNSSSDNEGSTYSTPDNRVQRLHGFRQGNGISDRSDGAGSGAVSGAKVKGKQRQLQYEHKIDAMTVIKLKEACRERSLPVSGVKAVLQQRLRTAGTAKGRAGSDKGKRKKPKRKRDVVVIDASSADEFVQTRPAQTGGDGGGGGGGRGVGERSRGDGEGSAKKKGRTRKKPKYGGTPATFTRYNSEGIKKRTPDGLDSDETTLYWDLIKWRTKLAKANRVESYFILPNQTIYGLVEASRNDSFLLKDVSGLGGEGRKRKRYGAQIIDILRKHHTQIQDRREGMGHNYED